MKIFGLDFTGLYKNPSVLFFIFLLWRLSNHFYQRSYEKPPVYITNIKVSLTFPHFLKDLRSRTFWQWIDGSFKKKERKNYAFWRLILRNVKKKNFLIFRFCQIWPEVLWFWKIVIQQVILAQITDRRTCYFVPTTLAKF